MSWLCIGRAAFGQGLRRVVMEAVRVPVSSRAPARVTRTCRSVPGRQPLSVALGWGCLLHPAPQFAVGSQCGRPIPPSLAWAASVTQWLPTLSLCVPLLGHFTGCCGCGFAHGMPGRAPQPPLRGQMPLILLAAQVAGGAASHPVPFRMAAVSWDAGCRWTGACPGCFPADWLPEVLGQQLVLGDREGTNIYGS